VGFLIDKARSLTDPGSRSRTRGCRRLRNASWAVPSLSLGPDALWIQRHLARCSRCRKRLAGWRHIELAFAAVKSQPHALDLLARANTETLRMLEHDLREAPQAQGLAEMRVEPSFLERSFGYRHWASHVAACFVALLLAKAGLFSSLDRLSTDSEKVVRQYYTSHVGDDLAEEVFDS